MLGDQVIQTPLHKLESSASNIFTENIFKLVSRGVHRSLFLRVSVYKKTSTCVIYFVSNLSRTKKWTVLHSVSSMNFKCSCLRMESHGIPCDHILVVLADRDLSK